MPRQITFQANPGKLQDMVDNAINRALINQSSVLSNTIFNAVARTFKEGQAPPLYMGPAYHQLGLSSVTAPSAPPAVVGIEATSPPSTLGMTNGQSTPMRTNLATSEGRVHRHRLCQDLYSRIAKFLPIGGDMVCPQNSLQIVLEHLRWLTWQGKLL